MPPLDPSHFAGGSEAGPEADLRKIEVGNFEDDVDKVLKHYFKWKGKYFTFLAAHSFNAKDHK
jgi:hypothetical protein